MDIQEEQKDLEDEELQVPARQENLSNLLNFQIDDLRKLAQNIKTYPVVLDELKRAKVAYKNSYPLSMKILDMFNNTFLNANVIEPARQAAFQAKFTLDGKLEHANYLKTAIAAQKKAIQKRRREIKLARQNQ